MHSAARDKPNSIKYDTDCPLPASCITLGKYVFNEPEKDLTFERCPPLDSSKCFLERFFGNQIHFQIQF